MCNYQFIEFYLGIFAGELSGALLQDRGIKVEPRMNLDSLESIAIMVANGLGVSIVPHRGIKRPFPPGVKVVAFGVNPVKRVVGVVERVASPKREIVQVLTAALIEQAEQGQ